MKKTLLILLFTGSIHFLEAQTNTNGVPTPNTGANTTVPPSNASPPPNNEMANPTNSTTPGANGSFSIDPGKPDLSQPNTNGSYSVYPRAPQGTATVTPQSGKKKK